MTRGAEHPALLFANLTMAMDIIPLKPERKAQLEEYAQLHGQTPADALDALLAARLDWEGHEYQDAVRGIRSGYEDWKAGQVQSSEDFLEELLVEHGFPR